MSDQTPFTYKASDLQPGELGYDTSFPISCQLAMIIGRQAAAQYEKMFPGYRASLVYIPNVQIRVFGAAPVDFTTPRPLSPASSEGGG